MPIYSEKVMDHFTNPRNVGEIENADGIGEVGNPVCGDMMTFYIKVKDNRLDCCFQYGQRIGKREDAGRGDGNYPEIRGGGIAGFTPE